MEYQVHRKIAELLLPCSLEIADVKHFADLAASSFRQELLSVRSKLQEIVTDREKFANLKSSLRETEDILEKATLAKNSNVVKQKNASKSLTTAKARNIELKKTFISHTVRKDEYASIISQQLQALITLEDQCSQMNDESNQEAILWYDKVLGFKALGGTGVKFTFTRIDCRNPEKEFSFTVKLHGDIYSLVQCDLKWDHLSDLVEELNKTNDLFKFVRIMRNKFVTSVLSDSTSCQNICTTTLSSSQLSTDSGSELLSTENDSSLQQLNGQCNPVNASGSIAVGLLSPENHSSLPHLNGQQCNIVSSSRSTAVGLSSESRLSKPTDIHHLSKSPKSVSALRRSQRILGSASKR